MFYNIIMINYKELSNTYKDYKPCQCVGVKFCNKDSLLHNV